MAERGARCLLETPGRVHHSEQERSPGNKWGPFEGGLWIPGHITASSREVLWSHTAVDLFEFPPSGWPGLGNPLLSHQRDSCASASQDRQSE
jgi:hypothetical protein